MLKGLGCFKFSPSGFCVVTLCHGKENGKDFFAFIAIEPQNYRYFQKRYRAGEAATFKPYGFELMRGSGLEPPTAVMDYLRKKHGVEFGVSEDFLNRLITNIDPVASPLGREYYTNLASASNSSSSF
jgi:hypothetical protein